MTLAEKIEADLAWAAVSHAAVVEMGKTPSGRAHLNRLIGDGKNVIDIRLRLITGNTLAGCGDIA